MSRAPLPARDLGNSPINSSSAAGENPRDNETYATIQTQLDRLTDIHTESAVDWALVASLSEKILKEEGKDLSAAVWLTSASMHEHGPEGLAAGIHILNDLVGTYWDTMFPPPARLRGRRNQMQWLLDQMTEYLQSDHIALPADTHAELLADWNTLDETWQSHDAEAPAFYGLRRLLAAMPVVATATEQSPAAGGQADGAPPGSSTQASGTNNTSQNTSAVPTALSPVMPPANGADPEAVIDGALEQMQVLIDWCLRDFPTLPLLFRLNRICAWASLSDAPPYTGNATLIPGPPDTLVDGLTQVQQGTEPQAIVQFIEARVITQRYWLDLNRISHAALNRIGASDAAATVAFETSQLLARLPQLRELTFNDGRPFADAQTLAWLDALGTTGSAPQAADHDTLDRSIANAVADAVAGKLDDAMAALQAMVVKTNSTRDRFRLRLAQCDLLYRFDPGANIGFLLASLIEELDVYQLSRWEPDLAGRALELAAAVEQRHGLEADQPSASLLTRLAGIDCHSAWRLLQTTPSS